MSISDSVRQRWIKTQRNFHYPVNAIGVKIAASDEKTLKVWQDEGIDVTGKIQLAGTNTSQKSLA